MIQLRAVSKWFMELVPQKRCIGCERKLLVALCRSSLQPAMRPRWAQLELTGDVGNVDDLGAVVVGMGGGQGGRGGRGKEGTDIF